jgi:hypothetical protein
MLAFCPANAGLLQQQKRKRDTEGKGTGKGTEWFFLFGILPVQCTCRAREKQTGKGTEGFSSSRVPK